MPNLLPIVHGVDCDPSFHALPPHPDMIWIPGGTFRMGSDRHYPEEAPVHRVMVDAFWIDRETKS
jgi:formylglycine-generating enzyme required for sulfatase activity